MRVETQCQLEPVFWVSITRAIFKRDIYLGYFGESTFEHITFLACNGSVEVDPYRGAPRAPGTVYHGERAACPRRGNHHTGECRSSNQGVVHSVGDIIVASGRLCWLFRRVL